jgi:exodeoxyribonuclease VII small subunit
MTAAGKKVDVEQSGANGDEIRYRDAMAELEGLLDEIDNDGVDLDELALKVERASRLITVCRDKIEQTEMQVKSIIEGLEKPARDAE